MFRVSWRGCAIGAALVVVCLVFCPLISYRGDVSATIGLVTPVAEPAILAMLTLGGLLLFRRHRTLRMLMLIAFLLPACSFCHAQTYTAAQFGIDANLIGKTMRLDGNETTTEKRFWLGGDPLVTTWSGTRYLRFVPASAVIDGYATNARMMANEPGSGFVNPEGTPFILSAADGWINFGDHPSCTGEREHFINGYTMVPATMTIGVSFADTRCTSWEGHWEGDQDWTGAIESNITIVGIESVTLPTGVYDALRIDKVSDHTKNGVLGTHWTIEHWDTSLWLVEGMGIVKMTESSHDRHYDTAYDNGNSLLYESAGQGEYTITLVPEPATIGLLVLGAAALIGLRRQ
jgi:hypothetical protein